MKSKRRVFSAEDKKTLVLKVIKARNYSNVREACSLVGIAPKQYYQWTKLLKSGGLAALEQKSKRPKTFANQLSETTRQRVIFEAESGNHRSANAIRNFLKTYDVNVSVPKVIEILEGVDLYGFIEVRDKDQKLVSKHRGLKNITH
jgi:transposase-like protein